MLLLVLTLRLASMDMPAYISDGPLAHPPARRGGAIWCPPSDDSVYIYGGKGQSSRLYDLWKYEEQPHHVDGGRWFLLFNSTIGDSRGGLSGMAHWMDATGTRLWIHGGRYDDGSISPDMGYYDVQWRTTTQVSSPLPLGPRFGHLFWYRASTDSFFVYGGKAANGTILQDMWTFHVPSMKWASIGISSGPGPLDDSGVTVSGNNAYIFGGEARFYDLWVYDMVTSLWSPLSTPSGGIGSLENPIMLARGDHLIVSGGRLSTGESTPNTIIYTISTNTWVSGAPIIGPRWGSSACVTPSGVGWVFGGVNGAKYYNDLWIHKHTTTTASESSPSVALEIILVVFLFLLIGGMLVGAVVCWRKTIKTEVIN